MTVKVNKLLLAEMLDGENGAVGRVVGAYAGIIRDLARGNAQDIIVSMPTSTFDAEVAPSIDVQQDGTTAVIGIRDSEPPAGKKESIEAYLARKELRELVWLYPAAAETFAADNQAAVSRLLGLRNT